MNDIKKLHWGYKLGAAAFTALAVLLLTQNVIFNSTPLDQLELKFIDTRFRERGELELAEEPKVVIVEISQESYKEILPPNNAWPWPRSYFAKLIQNLNAAGAKAIGIDLIMSEEDRFSLENDSLLFNTIKEAGNVVVAGKVEDFEESKSLSTNSNLNVILQKTRISVKTEDENFSNIFYSADSSIGIVQVPLDNDGVVRRYMPFVYSASVEKRIPTFGFALLNKYYGKNLFVDKNDNSFLIDNISIPKYDKVSFLINYYGSHKKFPHYKFIDIIDDKEFRTQSEVLYDEDINVWDDPDIGYLHSGIFKDKIVLIGSTLPEDKDLFSVSLSKGRKQGDNILYGVEIHANVINSILENNFISRMPKNIEALLVLILAFLSFYASSKVIDLKVKSTLIVQFLNIGFVLLSAGSFYVLSFYLFSSYNYILPIVSPIFALAAGNFASTVFTFVLEKKKNKRIKKMFGYYVNESLVEELIRNPNLLQLGGERKNLTVLFSDIAGFSTFSEKKKPEELVYFLNEYLSAMTEIVLNNKGTLDKYVGDAVMAFWGAPLKDDEHAFNCCITAIEMQRKLNELRVKWNVDINANILTRIGINSGEMVVGNIGGIQRFDYTVIGDNVNLASRLEGVNKVYGTDIIISENTYELVKERVFVRELDNLIVKGKTLPVKVYELIDIKENINNHNLRFYNYFDDGLSFYKKKDFVKAKEFFEKGISLNPLDNPSKLYLKRCSDYIDMPPGEEWEAVVKLDSK